MTEPSLTVLLQTIEQWARLAEDHELLALLRLLERERARRGLLEAERAGEK